MPSEVQYERMRPRQIIAAREAFPAAYLPCGTLEWHGFHNPVGLDALKAQALAVRCARAGGGVVFPPVWYGESREEGLMEVTGGDARQIVEAMKLPPENFSPGYMRFTPQEQYAHYTHHLLHTMYEIQSLGFKVITLVTGHYPLLDHARAACHLFHQARFRGKRASAITWAFIGCELVSDLFPEAGDHAGFWETSLMLALLPELVDMNELPKDEKTPLVGILSNRPVQQANAEYGERAIAAIAERVNEKVRDRLNNPQAYYGHGARLET